MSDNNTKPLNEKATELKDLQHKLSNEQRLGKQAEALANRYEQALTELLKTQQQLASASAKCGE